MSNKDATEKRSPSPASPLPASSIALTLLTVVLWGGTPVAIRYSVDTLPPFTVAGIRFTLATIFMLFWCHIEGAGLTLARKQLKPVVIAGILLFVQIGTFNLGIQKSNASHGTLFINTFIFWVAGIEHLITHADRISPRKLLGLVIAASGILVILTTGTPDGIAWPTFQNSETLLGDLILLFSACVLGIKIVYMKSALRIIEPGKLVFWHDIVGVAAFALYATLFEEVSLDGFSTPAVLGLLYQGFVVAGFCFAMQTWLLRRHSASQISVFSFLTPLVGVIVAVLIRGEPLSPWIAVAGLCVACGILLVNTPARRPIKNQTR